MGLKAVASPFAHPPAGYNFGDAETPTGTVDGVNAAFTLTHAPSPATSLMLELNGIMQAPAGVDYTLSGTTITYGVAPGSGSIHRAWYRY